MALDMVDRRRSRCDTPDSAGMPPASRARYPTTNWKLMMQTLIEPVTADDISPVTQEEKR